MKSLRTYIVFLVFTCLVSFSVVAQRIGLEWQVGYFTPYLSNIGVELACAFDLKELGIDSNEQRKSKQRLQILTKFGYFTQTNVSQNILLTPELVYRWNKLDKRFFLFSSVGTGYLISFQRQDGTLNLGTGEIVYRNEAFNYFLPTLSMGIGVDPKKHFGFFFKTTYGRMLSTQNPNTGVFAISTGLIFKFNSKNKK